MYLVNCTMIEYFDFHIDINEISFDDLEDFVFEHKLQYCSEKFFKEYDDKNPIKKYAKEILVKGNMVGDVMFYGQGAGKLATASAVVSDIIEEARNLNKHVDIKWDNEKIKLGDIGELCSSFFVRIKGDRKELCEKIANLFIKVEEVNIGIESEYAFIVRDIKENEFKECSGKIGNIINAIRIKD